VIHSASSSDQSCGPDVAPVLGGGAGKDDNQVPACVTQGLGDGIMLVRNAMFFADRTAQGRKPRAQRVASLVERAILNGFWLGLDQCN
jgi:hypothetical protein